MEKLPERQGRLGAKLAAEQQQLHDEVVRKESYHNYNRGAFATATP